MFKILKIEAQHYFKEPLAYGFFMLPIILLMVFSLGMPRPYALSSTIFIQVILSSLFIYGNKVMIYKNDTLRKKVNNSNLSKYKIITALIILNFLYIIMTLIVPVVWVMIDTHSLSWAEKNQWWYFVGENSINLSLKKGLTEDLLLFNSNIQTIMQFIFAYMSLNILALSFAHIMTIASKDNVRYFSISIIIAITIILISNVFSKDMFVMTDGAYVQNSMTIRNSFWKVLRNTNPFYWANQLLINTVVADVNSGTYILGDVDTGLVTDGGVQIIMEGQWIPTYYNVFHIGTNADPTINTQRPVIIDSCEINQLLILTVPPIFGLSLTSINLLIGEVK